MQNAAGEEQFVTGESEIISENEMPAMGREIQKEETYIKYGDAERRIGIEAIEKHGTCVMVHFPEIPDEASLIGGIFAYTVETNPFRPDALKRAHMLAKIEN